MFTFALETINRGKSLKSLSFLLITLLQIGNYNVIRQKNAIDDTSSEYLISVY